MDHNLIHANPALDEARKPIYSWSVILSADVFFIHIPNTLCNHEHERN
jgi:hypothetical protein